MSINLILQNTPPPPLPPFLTLNCICIIKIKMWLIGPSHALLLNGMSSKIKRFHFVLMFIVYVTQF